MQKALNPQSIPADWYLNPAVWSYGFATLGFAGFAVQLSVGWKGGGRALLLLASVTLSVFWAGSTVAFSLDPGWPLWRLSHSFDTLRLACACGSLSTQAPGGTDGQPTLEEALDAWTR